MKRFTYTMCAHQCGHDGCTSQAYLGKRGEAYPARFCYAHKRDGDVDVRGKPCSKCDERAYWREPGTDIVNCVLHKTPSSLPLYNTKKCSHQDCLTNICGESEEERYCSLHKPKKQALKKSYMVCKFVGCEKVASYGSEAGRTLQHCFKHRLPTEVNVRKTNCTFVSPDGIRCNVSATYGDLGVKTRKFCFTHKGVNHVRIGAQICIVENCNTTATYKLPTDKGYKYCGPHRPPGSIPSKRGNYDEKVEIDDSSDEETERGKRVRE